MSIFAEYDSIINALYSYVCSKVRLEIFSRWCNYYWEKGHHEANCYQKKNIEGLKESDTAVTPWDNASEGNMMSSREAVAKEENR